jgi:hypothetical protein
LFLSDDAAANTPVNASGDYIFPNLSSGGNYTVRPEKNTGFYNGIMVNDALAIQQHLAGNILITDPAAMVAADVNHNNTVSTFDALLIKQGVPEGIAVNNLTSDVSNAHFTAIKMADVVGGFADPANLVESVNLV